MDVKLEKDYFEDQPPVEPNQPLEPTKSIDADKTPAYNHKTSKIYVKGLTKNVTSAHLSEIFSTYGAIKSVDLAMDYAAEWNKGIAYIDYKDFEMANKAMEFMNGGQIDGAELVVGFAKTSRPSAPVKSLRYGQKRRGYYKGEKNEYRERDRRGGDDYSREKRGRSPVKSDRHLKRRKSYSYSRSYSSSYSRSYSRSPSYSSYSSYSSGSYYSRSPSYSSYSSSSYSKSPSPPPTHRRSSKRSPTH